MAKRTILNVNTDNETLRKKSREVENIDDRILTLLNDMAETMYDANGVRLAAPQVGILKRIVVIDVGDGLIELINPVITYKKGEQINPEGCLSVPGKTGTVARPEKVKVRALNRNGEEINIDADGLLAIALCHEIDHLSGTLYIDNVIAYIED
ncbi:MAG: peptide deformylase [Clostridia bacterium]|nr:peptide deformylase [Clostridia bacterium]